VSSPLVKNLRRNENGISFIKAIPAIVAEVAILVVISIFATVAKTVMTPFLSPPISLIVNRARFDKAEIKPGGWGSARKKPS
jgi:hypothetical protein